MCICLSLVLCFAFSTGPPGRTVFLHWWGYPVWIVLNNNNKNNNKNNNNACKQANVINTFQIYLWTFAFQSYFLFFCLPSFTVFLKFQNKKKSPQTNNKKQPGKLSSAEIIRSAINERIEGKKIAQWRDSLKINLALQTKRHRHLLNTGASLVNGTESHRWCL